MRRPTPAIRRAALAALCGLALAPHPTEASFTLLTTGKALSLRGRADPARARGLIRFTGDPGLAEAVDPCSAPSRFELGVYASAVNRVVRGPAVALECERWRATRSGWVYDDPDAAGGVRRIRYGARRLVVQLAGAAVLPAPGPAGYVQMWLDVGARRFHGRFHDFRTNRAERIVGRRPSSSAAAGEAAFWDVLWGDDRSEARQQESLRLLTRASRRSRRDGRSRFLLAMLRLYRFGQRTVVFADADDEARSELTAAVSLFDEAERLLWDGTSAHGDSRVPGFAAAARYALGVVLGDAARRTAGLADLTAAIEANAFFNVFDLITVAQAEPADSAAFAAAFGAMDTYLADPETLACLGDQPEICSTVGFAPSNLAGSLVLFGDLYAKAGNAARARDWYRLASAAERGWPFEGLAADRLASVDARVVAYQADPVNGPPIIGAAGEACAVCHLRPAL